MHYLLISFTHTVNIYKIMYIVMYHIYIIIQIMSQLNYISQPKSPDLLINNISQACPISSKMLRITVKFIQVIRTTVEVFHPQVSTIISSGVMNSFRTIADGYFKIGRQQVTESGERPNDLVLPPTDRAISRSHCKINYQPFFDTTIPDN